MSEAAAELPARRGNARIHLRVRQTEILLRERLALGDVCLLELGQQRNDGRHGSGFYADVVKLFAMSGREKGQTPHLGYLPCGIWTCRNYIVSSRRPTGQPISDGNGVFDVVKRVALERLAAGGPDERRQLGHGQPFRSRGPGHVVNLLLLDGAVQVVHAKP